MVDEDVTEHESDATVRGFVVLPKKQVVWLPDLRRDEAPEQQFRLGAAPYSDIRIGSNPEVADTHCLLVWSLERLEVRDRAPGKLTLFNGMAVNGFAHMCAGDVLTIGSKKQLLRKPKQLTHIMAFRHSPDESPKIPGRNFPDFVVKAREYLGGNDSKVARTIQIERTTYKRKLKQFSAALVITGILALGGYWLFGIPQSGSGVAASAEDSQPEPLSQESTLTAPAGSLPSRLESTTEQCMSAPVLEAQGHDESPKDLDTPSTKRKRPKRARKPHRPRIDEEPKALGVSYHSPIGARGVSARDVKGER